MTDEEVHEIWLRPRLLGYAQALGVRWEVSDLDAEGKITVKLVN